MLGCSRTARLTPPSRPSMVRLVSALLLCLAGTPALPLSLVAQDAGEPRLGPEGRVGAVVGLRTTAMVVADHLVPMVGLGLGIRLSPHLELMGEGSVGLRDVPVSSAEAQTLSDLALGYGGLLLRYGPTSGGTEEGFNTHILLGAGTSRLRSPLVAAELNSDNFRILETGLEYRLSLPRSWIVAVGGGYRFTSATTELPAVEAGPMRGPYASLSLLLLRRP